MNKQRALLVIAVAIVAGAITPWLVPDDWLSYAFWACLLSLLIFGGLAAGRAEGRHDNDRVIAPFWIHSPLANVKDPQALALFLLTLAYLAGLAFGAFAVVRS